ncbi:MAG: LacI family DNA-binding transcriptional regulator [Reinekea sp.]|jgi:LacI family transcriptional regulator
MSTIKEVSRLANVSVATVSRVVNGNKWVSEATKTKVLAAMKELGYQPNSFAKALATNRSDTVGMVVSELGGAFFGEMMYAAEDRVRATGKHLIITSGHDTRSTEKDAIDFLMQRQVDALLLHVDALTDDDLIQLTDSNNIPIILINRFVPELAEQCISLDNEMGGFIATQHLIDLGHEEIVCITGPLFKVDARARLAGYRRALEKAGLVYDENRVIESNYQEQGGQIAIDRLRRREQTFTAIVAQNDHMAIGAMNALKQLGIKIGDETSIVGYDNMVMSRYTEPALTTIHIPVADFGQRAADLALNMMGLQNKTLVKRFQPELIARSSTAVRKL